MYHVSPCEFFLCHRAAKIHRGTSVIQKYSAMEKIYREERGVSPFSVGIFSSPSRKKNLEERFSLSKKIS